MRRVGALLVTTLCVLLVSAPAHGATQIEDARTDVVQTVDACTGEESVITFTFRAVHHENQTRSGGWHAQFANAGNISIEPLNGSGVEYSGHFNESLGIHIAGPNETQVFTFRFTAHMTGSDGSKRHDTGSQHVTVKPDGTIAVEFGDFICR